MVKLSIAVEVVVGLSPDAVGVRAEVLLVPTRGGVVPLRVEITEEDQLYISSEVVRGKPEELLSFGVIALAAGLADTLGMRTRPLMRTLHLRIPGNTRYVNVPDALEIMAGERIQEFVILLKQFLAGEAR